MNDLVKERCDLLISNRAQIAKKFTMDSNLMCITSGLLFASEVRSADIEKMTECKKLLRKETGHFSKLKSTAELAVLSKMLLSDDPEQYLKSVITVYDKVKTADFCERSYIVPVCLMIVDLAIQDELDDILNKAQDILKSLDKSHPVLTGSDDSSLAVLLALSYKDTATILADIETGYTYLKKNYRLGVPAESVQELCEVLALSYGDICSKCDKVARIYEAFRKRKSSYGKDREFAMLASLVDIEISPETIVNEIISVSEYLEKDDGFKDKQLTAKQRMMYATLLFADFYGRNTGMMDNPVITGTLSILADKSKAALTSALINCALELIPTVLGAVTETEEKRTTDEHSDLRN
ncbi:MAG: DUF4003 family protein [Lachnospiraceae bacterium]|nr:DUF4003 family protein [Lachnospiraceae bacterium]